jgi:hypothetical protein
MDVAQNIENALFQKDSEKTFIDKILAKEDVKRIAELVKKQNLSREEMLELLYMLSSTESKLVNYEEWDRYVIVKFFIWIREFVKIMELFFDFKENLESRELTGGIETTERTKRVYKSVMRLMEHNVKFLVDLYFNIIRSTLSIGATGMLEILKNKYEVSYTGNAYGGIQMQQPSQAGLFGGRKK